jgi:hypothetical protein
MQSKAATVEEYLAELPEERREALEAIRAVILKNLPKGVEEGMQYGMIGYYVPHSVYPAGYHCDPKQPLPYASLASQKNYISLYLMGLYSNTEHEAWFCEEWKKAGKKLDMGKSCVRIKKLEDAPLQVIGKAIKRVPVKKHIESYEAVIVDSRRVGGGKGNTKKRAATKATAKKKAPRKKRVVKKTTKKRRS